MSAWYLFFNSTSKVSLFFMFLSSSQFHFVREFFVLLRDLRFTLMLAVTIRVDSDRVVGAC